VYASYQLIHFIPMIYLYASKTRRYDSSAHTLTAYLTYASCRNWAAIPADPIAACDTEHHPAPLAYLTVPSRYPRRACRQRLTLHQWPRSLPAPRASPLSFPRSILQQLSPGHHRLDGSPPTRNPRLNEK